MKLCVFANCFLAEVTKKKKKKNKSKLVLVPIVIHFPDDVFTQQPIISYSVIHRKKKESPKQTDPPSIPVVDLFPSGEFPEGEIQQYKDE